MASRFDTRQCFIYWYKSRTRNLIRQISRKPTKNVCLDFPEWDLLIVYCFSETGLILLKQNPARVIGTALKKALAKPVVETVVVPPLQFVAINLDTVHSGRRHVRCCISRTRQPRWQVVHKNNIRRTNSTSA